MFKVQHHYYYSEFEWNFFEDDLFRSLISNLFVAMEYNLEIRNISSNLHQMRNYDCVSRAELFWEEEYTHHLLYKSHKYRNKRTFYGDTAP